MSDAIAAPRPRRSFAVTALGLVTLLHGLFFAAIGVTAIVAGGWLAQNVLGLKQEAQHALNEAGAVSTANTPSTAPGLDTHEAKEAVEVGANSFAAIIVGFAAFVGGCVMLYGLPTLLTGIGLMLRAGWARVLTLVLAVFVGLEGLGIVLNYNNDYGIYWVGTGVALLLYAVLAFVILLNKSNAAEFTRQPTD